MTLYDPVLLSLSPLRRFLYSDEVHIGPETVMTTLYTAKKYAVPALEGHCVEFLTKHLRADNAFMLLTQVNIVHTARNVSVQLSYDSAILNSIITVFYLYVL